MGRGGRGRGKKGEFAGLRGMVVGSSGLAVGVGVGGWQPLTRDGVGWWAGVGGGGIASLWW